MSISPSPTPFHLPSSTSSSALGTPARMWSSVPPSSTAASSPAPEEVACKEGEDEEMPVDDFEKVDASKGEKNGRDDNASPFLRGVPVVVDADPAAAVEEADDSAEQEQEQEQEQEGVEGEGELTASQLSRLEHVLERSALYSQILKQQMDDARERHAVERAAAAAALDKKSGKGKAKGKAKAKGRPAKKRRTVADSDDELDLLSEEKPADADADAAAAAALKDYQLEGLQWMVGLHEQGISGILADEMGLGKTLQTIAFAAHLRATGTRPFLVVCPLSVLHNWISEFARFAPAIPVLMYHGTPAERAEMRRTHLALPEGWTPTSASAPAAAPATTKAKGKGKGNGKAKGRPSKAASRYCTRTCAGTGRGRGGARGGKGQAAPASPARRSGRTAASASTSSARGRGGKGGKGAARAGTKRKRGEEEDEEEEEDAEEEDASDSDAEEEEADPASDTDDNDEPKSTTKKKTKAELAKAARDAAHDAHFAAFPVVVTTYDLIIRDRGVMGGIPWGYIVVDEGHRLKNMHCALMREIKRYSSAGRMVLTGTPLHNNLAELWSLLNFILPDIFDDVDAFQEWFSLPRMAALLPSARMGTFISTLHTILKPFLLRRMKVDVLGPLLPPKKSYVLYARLSARQREAYEAVLGGGIRAWVAGGAGAKSASASVSASAGAGVSKGATAVEDEAEDEGGRTMRTRRRSGKGKGKDKRTNAEREAEEEEERRRAAEAFVKRGTQKHVNNMKLQNTVMQLRKVCSHPFLFASPDDDVWASRLPPTPALLAAREAELLGASGKMLLLDRLLGELFRRGHKVLLFSQFTTMLDIIEDWAVDMKGWRICRIDGTTPPLERRDQMNEFQTAGDAPDAPRLFLLSTRSGGLGVNLTAADTVIFYDQDWNPQMDAQAQDRAHRIGQKKPVLIFRLVSAHTIEEKIMQKATEKRKLEALVIAKGKFKMPAADTTTATGKRATMAEVAADLLRLEGEQIDVLPTTTQAGDANILSDADLEALLDRSPEVFADRGTGWRSEADGKGQAAFAVFEPPLDAGSEALAGMMGEEEVVGEE
ncbi:SNF2 family N-terminal domain-containing protein [Mycena galopus ATCC 62051]|nr:SNF2 family N-terminal domain-containing protein [Mycena galopus ATCC 62051]